MENIIKIIKGVNGYTYDSIYDLYFTEERLIYIYLSGPLYFKESSGARNLSEIFTGSIFRIKEEKLRRIQLEEEKRKLLNRMEPDQVLHDIKDSHEIPYKTIQKIKFSRGLTGFHIKISFDVGASGNMEIKFHVKRQQYAEIRDLLYLIIPKKIQTVGRK